MALQLSSTEQVLVLAPDASSVAASKKLAHTKHWQHLGQSAEALWGECQRSALYQVCIDLSTLTMTCSCPSRKLPCKHSLGLLLLAVNTPADVPTSEAPEWVSSWLVKRAAASKRKEIKETNKTPDTSPSTAQLKRTEKRQAQMLKGLDRLDLWLHDLIRNGLASVESQPAKFWEEQATQMVDAQLPGLGNRLRRMATIPNSSPQWPAKLLTELGKVALLTHAFRRYEHIDAALQVDIRQLVGWSIDQEEVTEHGETVTDTWLILGQRINNDEKVREQWTWMWGTQLRRTALILQYTFGQAPFTEAFPVGTSQVAELTFWPGASPQRARLEARRAAFVPLHDPLPGIETIEGFLASVAGMLARQPWQEHFLCILKQATPVCTDKGSQWYIRDMMGAVLPLSNDEHWRLLALSGGYPIDFVGEWNGETLFPLGMHVDSTYYIL